MIVVEGTDGVGKTSTINALRQYKLLDRDKNISRLISVDIALSSRAQEIYDYLKNKDEVVIFMVNNNKKELEKRIYSRDRIDKYDELTYLYNLLYLETYEYMEKNKMSNDKLLLADVTNLNFEEQVALLNDIIKKVMKDEY